MSFRKLFYQFINIVKYYRAIYTYNIKINTLLKKINLKSLSNKATLEIRNNFSKYGFNKISIKWHRYYSGFHNEMDINFIPESLFYTRIEPALNQAVMYPALEDKNLLDKFFPSSLLPKNIIKNSNGFYYVDNTQVSIETAIKKCCEHDEFVIKPSIGTNGGEGVKKIDLGGLENKPKRIKKLFLEYSSDFIVQEILKQNIELSKLNESSINTIRIISYMRVTEVVPLSAVIRIGRAGEFTDNMSLRGIACGINVDGRLKDFAVDQFGGKYSATDNGTLLKDYQIPHFEKMLSTVKDIHRNLPYFKLISWDITINEKSEVKMIEYNTLGQGINVHQMINGPLFHNYFDEILNFSQKYNSLDQQMKYGK